MNAHATALERYSRIECPGLWRPDPSAQRSDVVVSFGAATLVIADKTDRALAHWSLAAVARINPGDLPALFTPSAEATETLEIDDETMVDAIETVRRAVARARPRRGRLRGMSVAAGALALGLVAAIWLPEALVRHAVAALPSSARVALGADLEAALTRVAGAPCRSPRGDRALTVLEARLVRGGAGLAVLPDEFTGAQALPGGRIMLGRDLVEDHDTPEVLAGHILAARVEADLRDPLAELLTAAGPLAVLRLLTSGHLPEAALERHAVDLAAGPGGAARTDGTVSGEAADTAPPERLVAAFAEAQVAVTPYAYALDVTGETVLPLIEADPFGGTTPGQLLGDGDWIALQTICAP